MSKRTIAEIIGWKPAGRYWIEEPEDTWEADTWEVNGVRTHRPPTVDDMLAWLVAGGHVWSAQKFRTGVSVSIAYVETGVEWIPPAFEAPTLREAVEAAVRVVDSAWEGSA